MANYCNNCNRLLKKVYGRNGNSWLTIQGFEYCFYCDEIYKVSQKPVLKKTKK